MEEVFDTLMATIKTTKKFHLRQLADLLGGDLHDVSTTPLEGPDGLVGVPLDADGEKEITVTVKGDGETPITQEELETLVASYTYDPNYGLSVAAKRRRELAAKPTLTQPEMAEAIKMLLEGK